MIMIMIMIMLNTIDLILSDCNELIVIVLEQTRFCDEETIQTKQPSR